MLIYLLMLLHHREVQFICNTAVQPHGGTATVVITSNDAFL